MASRARPDSAVFRLEPRPFPRTKHGSETLFRPPGTLNLAKRFVFPRQLEIRNPVSGLTVHSFGVHSECGLVATPLGSVSLEVQPIIFCGKSVPAMDLFCVAGLVRVSLFGRVAMTALSLVSRRVEPGRRTSTLPLERESHLFNPLIDMNKIQLVFSDFQDSYDVFHLP